MCHFQCACVSKQGEERERGREKNLVECPSTGKWIKYAQLHIGLL